MRWPAELLIALALVLLTSGTSWAQEATDDDLFAASDAQIAAQIAMEAGDLEVALSKAQEAIDLDPSSNTWRARQIVIDLLEQRQRVGHALQLLPSYLELDLPSKQKLWGETARTRLGRRHGQRSAGIAFLSGAALSAVAGAGFLIHVARLEGLGRNDFATETGGAIRAGTIFLGVAGLSGAFGGVLVAVSRRPGPSSVPTIALQVSGRW